MKDFGIVSKYNSLEAGENPDAPNVESSDARIVLYADFLNSPAWLHAKNQVSPDEYGKIRELQCILEDHFFPEGDDKNHDIVSKSRGAISNLDKKQYGEIRITVLRFLDAFEGIIEKPEKTPGKNISKRIHREKITQRHKQINREVINFAKQFSNLDDYIHAVRNLIEHEDSLYITNFSVVIYQIGKSSWNNIESNNISEFLLYLARNIQKNKSEMNGQNIGNALYGLQGLDSSVVSRDFLDILGAKIASGGEMDSQAIGSALYGLQGLDSSVVSRGFLDILGSKIALGGEMDGQAIGSALYGLQGLYNLQNVIELVDILFEEVEKNLELNDVNIIYLVQQYSFYKREIPENIQDRYESIQNSTSNISYSEKQLFDTIKQVYPTAQSGKYIDGYELDIYIPELKLNIENDGDSHTGNKIFRDAKRDIYLLERHNIATIRFHIDDMDDFDQEVRKLIDFVRNVSQKNYEKQELELV